MVMMMMMVMMMIPDSDKKWSKVVASMVREW